MRVSSGFPTASSKWWTLRKDRRPPFFFLSFVLFFFFGMTWQVSAWHGSLRITWIHSWREEIQTLFSSILTQQNHDYKTFHACKEPSEIFINHLSKVRFYNQEIFTTWKFHEIASQAGSRQENIDPYSRQEIFANPPKIAKFAKISCMRKFPVLQY